MIQLRKVENGQNKNYEDDLRRRTIQLQEGSFVTILLQRNLEKEISFFKKKRTTDGHFEKTD